MKKICAYLGIFLLLVLATGIATAGQVLDKKQQAFFNGRRIAVSRDTNTKPGYVITTWYRNGRPDWKLPPVETNKLQAIAGKEQNNPLQNVIVSLTNVLTQVHAKYVTASNRYVTAETRIANAKSGLTEKRAEYVTKRDEAKLPTTKAIYQAFIDIIDDILNKLDALLTKEN